DYFCSSYAVSNTFIF
nr:immunoglobulin light chain junction region [Macaca mulatta]